MRRSLTIASLLVLALSGCAAADVAPQESPTAQADVTNTPEPEAEVAVAGPLDSADFGDGAEFCGELASVELVPAAMGTEVARVFADSSVVNSYCAFYGTGEQLVKIEWQPANCALATAGPGPFSGPDERGGYTVDAAETARYIVCLGDGVLFWSVDSPASGAVAVAKQGALAVLDTPGALDILASRVG